MPILEILRTEKTSPQVTVDLLEVAKRIKKIPILVDNSTGLVVNRIFVSYYHAAMILMEQGERKYIIEQAMKNFGVSISPFRETNPQPRKDTLWQATSDFTGGQASLHSKQ